MATNEKSLIMFKRGTQDQLTNVTVQDGVFYLTTDSNRLYVGQGTKMALLNQTVQIVDSIKHLPGEEKNPDGYKTTNDFYYCTAENVLAVYNGTAWVQINPDTNTTNASAEVTQTVGGTQDAVTLTTGFSVTDSDEDSVSDSAVITFEGSRGIDITAGTDKIIIASNVDFDLGVSGTENKASVALTGSGDSVDADAGKFDIVGDGIAIVSVEGSTIKVSVPNTNTDDYVASGSATGAYDSTKQEISISTTLVRKNEDKVSWDTVIDASNLVNEEEFAEGIDDLREEFENRLNGLDAMTYKGTLPDGASLPTEGVKAGDTYLALGAIAGVNGSKKGDLVIARGDEENGILTNPQWDLVPAGDDGYIDTTYDIDADVTSKTVYLANNLNEDD